MDMKREIIKIFGAWTEILSYGDYKHSSKVILVVPGNPGIIGFYEPFLAYIYKLKKIPVVGISHGGHLSGEHYTGSCNYLDLPEQIIHKNEFIKKYLPDAKQIYMIGHSLGCYIILKMLENNHTSKLLEKAILLFPAIEHLSKTSHGKFWTPVSYYCRYPLSMTGYVASFLPNSIKDFMISLGTKWRTLPDHLLEVGRSCFGYSILNHALYLGASEMSILSDIDEVMVKVIHENESKIVFYYGKGDGWVPHEFYEKMKDRFPNVDIRLCQHGFQHDFVLDCIKDISHICTEVFEN